MPPPITLGSVLAQPERNAYGHLVPMAGVSHGAPEVDADGEPAFKDVIGRVHSLESFSGVDGRGIRYMVFVQGCLLRCVMCCNPDSWFCHDARSKSRMRVSAVLQELQRCRRYLIASGGGVTVSGGEPLLQPYFLQNLFKGAHAMGLTTAIDTAGVAAEGAQREAWDRVLPHVDEVLWCPKGLSPAAFERMTRKGGPEYETSREFAAEVGRRGIPMCIRWVLMAGWTDTPAALEELAGFVMEHPTVSRVEVLPYHVLGRNKWAELGLEYPLGDMPQYDHRAAKAKASWLRDRLAELAPDPEHAVPVICD